MIETPELREIGQQLLSENVQSRESGSKVLGGDDGWKIRLNLKNPITGKIYDRILASRKLFTPEQLAKMSQAERIRAKLQIGDTSWKMSESDKKLYDKDAKKVLDWLIRYFKRDGENVVQMNGQGFNDMDGHYRFTDGKTSREPFKHLAGGEAGEADFTLYLGSRENVNKFIAAAKSDPELMKLLTPDGRKVNTTDVMLDDFFSGRFEGRSLGFEGYAVPGGELATKLSSAQPFLRTEKGVWYVTKDSKGDVEFNIKYPNGEFRKFRGESKEFGITYTDLRHALAQALFGEYVTGTTKHKQGGQINYNKLRK